MSKQGDWQKMGELITDDVLNAFAVVEDDPEDVPGALLKRFGDVVDRVSFYTPYRTDDPDQFTRLLQKFKS